MEVIVALYGLDGLPITIDAARALLTDLPSRVLGRTRITTTAGRLEVITSHTVFDQTRPMALQVEHVPVLYATHVIHHEPVTQYPFVAARYLVEDEAIEGHDQIVALTLLECPGRITGLEATLVG